MLGYLRRHQPGVVIDYAKGRLQKAPQDPDLLGLLGAALVDQGAYEAALDLFPQAEGSDFYEEHGIRYHADALRAVGDGSGAAALRFQRRLSPEEAGEREANEHLYRIDDFRLTGDWSSALDAVSVALASDAHRPLFYAVLADIYLDMGDWDEAEQALWFAQRMVEDEADNPRLLRVEARWMLVQGFPDQAVDMLLTSRRRNSTNLEFWMLLAEARRQQGSLMEAQTILELRRFSGFDTPTQRAVRARVLRDQGDLEGARRVLAEALAALPTNPTLLAAAEELGLP